MRQAEAVKGVEVALCFGDRELIARAHDLRGLLMVKASPAVRAKLSSSKRKASPQASQGSISQSNMRFTSCGLRGGSAAGSILARDQSGVSSLVPRSERDRIIEEVIATETFGLSLGAARSLRRSWSREAGLRLGFWRISGGFGRWRSFRFSFQHARLMPVRFSPSWPSAHRFVRAVRPPDPSQDIHACPSRVPAPGGLACSFEQIVR